MCLSGRIYNKTDHRKTFEGILYKMRTGIPWLDLPSYFGTWSAIYRRFNLWSKKDILSKVNGENPKGSSWLTLVTRCVVIFKVNLKTLGFLNRKRKKTQLPA